MSDHAVPCDLVAIFRVHRNHAQSILAMCLPVALRQHRTKSVPDVTFYLHSLLAVMWCAIYPGALSWVMVSRCDVVCCIPRGTALGDGFPLYCGVLYTLEHCLGWWLSSSVSLTLILPCTGLCLNKLVTKYTPFFFMIFVLIFKIIIMSFPFPLLPKALTLSYQWGYGRGKKAKLQNVMFRSVKCFNGQVLQPSPFLYYLWPFSSSPLFLQESKNSCAPRWLSDISTLSLKVKNTTFIFYQLSVEKLTTEKFFGLSYLTTANEILLFGVHSILEGKGFCTGQMRKTPPMGHSGFSQDLLVLGQTPNVNYIRWGLLCSIIAKHQNMFPWILALICERSHAQ